MWADALRDLAPTLAAALAVAVLSGTHLPRSRWAWRATVGAAAVVAVLMEVPVLRAEAAVPAAHVLARDVVASLAFHAGLVLVTAAVAARGTARGWPPSGRMGAGALTALVIAAIGPLVLLIVHCTSGDCL